MEDLTTDGKSKINFCNALRRAGAVVDAAALAWGALPLAARGPVEDAFRARLFSVPFGPAFYRGYVASVGEAPVDIREKLDLSP